MSTKEIESQIQSEIQEEINLHKIHMHILQVLKRPRGITWISKIYDEYG